MTMSESLKNLKLVLEEVRSPNGDLAKLLQAPQFSDIETDDRRFLLSSLLQFGMSEASVQGATVIAHDRYFGDLVLDFSRLGESLVLVNREEFKVPLELSLKEIEEEIVLPELRKRLVTNTSFLNFWDWVIPSAKALLSSCSEEQKESALNTAKTSFSLARSGLGVAGCFVPQVRLAMTALTCVGVACRTVSKCRQGESFSHALKIAVREEFKVDETNKMIDEKLGRSSSH